MISGKFETVQWLATLIPIIETDKILSDSGQSYSFTSRVAAKKHDICPSILKAKSHDL
jgi:hypothetical protein